MRRNPDHELFWADTVALLAEETLTAMAEKSPTEQHSIAALELALLVLKHPPFSIGIYRKAAA